ncbi:hypothetical protein D3A96_14845 [Robertkochia marina]|nr:hypothetical protein D3A96_14845 [Robertkochia marina]
MKNILLYKPCALVALLALSYNNKGLRYVLSGILFGTFGTLPLVSALFMRLSNSLKITNHF